MRSSLKALVLRAQSARKMSALSPFVHFPFPILNFEFIPEQQHIAYPATEYSVL
jgi:hypothetical protein